MIPLSHVSRRTLIAALTSGMLLTGAVGQSPAHSAEFQSAERKIAYLGENGRREHPATAPTVLTTAECNAYVNQGGVSLPEGISHVRFSTQPGVVRGEADVDFDRLTNGRTHSNLLLQLFTGRHHVVGVAEASADHGVAHVRLQSVEFDGIPIPRFALEYFAAKFLRPKFGPAYRVDSTFHLKNRIDSALPGEERVTIVQR